MDEATLIALGALLVSLLTALQGARLRRKTPQLTSRQIKRLKSMVEAEGRADLAVNVRDHRNVRAIDVINHGPADAHDVRVAVVSGASSLLQGEPERAFPVERMRAGEKASIIAAPTHGSSNVVELMVRWNDDGGKHSERFRADVVFG